MNSDIRIKISFKGHRKRHNLERLLCSIGATRYLVDLWLTAAQQRPDGNLRGWSAKDVALAGGYSGKPQKFVDSLLESGFLDQDGEGYRLHDWEEHQPWCCGAPRRSEQARRAARGRWQGGRDTPDEGRSGVGDTHSTPTCEAKTHALSINEHMPLSVSSPYPNRNPSSPSPEPEPDPLPPPHAPALVLFRENIEPLTPYVEKEIMKAVIMYGLTEVEAAIREAAIYNKLSWGYIREILEARADRGEILPIEIDSPRGDSLGI